jgi:hypothetical protein
MKILPMSSLLSLALLGCVSHPPSSTRVPPQEISNPAGIHPSSPWYPGNQALVAPSVASPRKPVAKRSQARLPFDGEVTESPSGNRTYRDRFNGRIAGSASTSPAGTTTWRDSDGRIAGTSDVSPSGTTTYRDGDGRISGTSSSTPDGGRGATTTYRRDGVIVGTQSVSPAGNVTWRDGSGRIIAGPDEMSP